MNVRIDPRSPAGRGALVAAVVVLAAVVAGADARASASTKGSSGSFKLTGEVVATLKVPAFLPPGFQAGCSISPSQSGTDVIVWDNQPIKEAGKTVTVANMNLQLQVEKFGNSYSLKVTKTGSTPAAAYLTTADPYQWMSVSGTISTAAGGKSGTIDAVLNDGSHHPGTITLKGSWAGCQSLG